jgi:integrase/recombinase XerD
MTGVDARALEGLTGRFLRWLEVHNASPLTTKTRGHQLARFITWCDARGLKTANDITRPLLERYQRSLYEYRREDGRRLSRLSQAHLMSAVVVFFKWLKKQRLILINPAAEIELPRYDRKMPKKVLSPKDVETFMNTIDVKTPLGLRDRAIFETLYSTGIRRAELVMLLLDDLDVDRGTLVIREGKGQKDRVVPIGDRALRFIDRYVTDVRPAQARSDEAKALFLTRHGEPLSKSSLSNMAADRLKAAGIAHGGCHLFRHSAATAMLEAGADVRFIQALLGHAHLTSTEIYTKVSVRKLKDVHTKTHPAKLYRHVSKKTKP